MPLVSSALFTTALTLSAQTSPGDFESWSGNVPDGWTTVDSGISLSPSTTAVSGSQSAAVEVTTTDQGSTDLRLDVAVTAGTPVDFSVWVRHTEGHMRARLYVDGYRGYSSASLTNQWQELSYTLNPSTTGTVEVGLRFYDVSGFDGAEIVYVDAFEPLGGSSSGGGGSGSGGGAGGVGCTSVALNLATDNYGSETSWEITDSGGATVASGSGYASNSSYQETACLSSGSYTFTIYDDYGDGICCNYGAGSYQLTVNGVTAASGSSFGNSQSTAFSVSEEPGDGPGDGGDDPGDGGDDPGDGGDGSGDGDAPGDGSGTGGGGSTCTTGEMSLTTDTYGSETSWSLVDGAAATVASGSGYAANTSYTVPVCLDDGSYTLIVDDSYGDGMCCSHGNGGYALTVGGTVVASGGSFSSSDSTSFTVGSGGGTGGGGGGGTGGGTGGGSSNLTGYYASANGLTGSALKTALYQIIRGHNNRGYSALWSFYSSYERDDYYENDGSILDIYSENPSGSDPYNYTSTSDQCGTYGGEDDCYNREHTFPKSYFNDGSPMVNDVHHILPTDGYVNGRRSNYPYGEVGSASWTSQNGCMVGTAASGLGYSGTVFEPIDEFKGDLARIYFYMATRYENVIANWENNSTHADAVLDGSSDHVYETWFLNMLLDWHTQDPVSQKELDRNDAAQTFQGNRNPFVDHPELVDEIW